MASAPEVNKNVSRIISKFKKNGYVNFEKQCRLPENIYAD